MRKLRIWALDAGGTIGHVRVAMGNGHAPLGPTRGGTNRAAFRQWAMDTVAPLFRDDVEIREWRVLVGGRDSQNVVYPLYTQLAQGVCDAQAAGADAVAFFCGTDRAESIMKGIYLLLTPWSERSRSRLRTAVVGTGALNPFGHPFSSAHENVCGVLATIVKARLCRKRSRVSDVLWVWRKAIFHGGAFHKDDPDDMDACDSPQMGVVGRVKPHGVELYYSRLRMETHAAQGLLAVDGTIQSGAKVVKAEGLERRLLMPDASNRHCRALVLSCAGDGGVCMDSSYGGRYDLIPPIEEAVRRGKPVVICSNIPGVKTGAQAYVVSRKPVEKGAVCAGPLGSTDVTLLFGKAWSLGIPTRTPKQVIRVLTENPLTRLINR